MQVNPHEIEDYYFPVNLGQVESLVGKMLTHIEATNLPASVEKASKDLVRQSIWRWWSEAQENSLTSYKGCIGPIKGKEGSSSDDIEYVWFTDIGKTRTTEHADVPWHLMPSTTESTN